MKKLEWVANQLSKITNNIRYEFSDEYYQNKAVSLTRDLDHFFEDAPKYLSACDLSALDHKEFVLDFDNESVMQSAIMILRSHNLLCEEDYLESSVAVNPDENLFRLTVSVYDISAYSFIYSKSNGASIRMLSEILNTAIRFSYYYFDYANNDDKAHRKGLADKGRIEFQNQISVKELASFEDFLDFNNALFTLIDVCPDLKKYKETKPKIKPIIKTETK